MILVIGFPKTCVVVVGGAIARDVPDDVGMLMKLGERPAIALFSRECFEHHRQEFANRSLGIGFLFNTMAPIPKVLLR